MQCDWSEEVSLLLDDELTSGRESEVRRHLLGCPSCVALVREWTELRESLGDLGDEPSSGAIEKAFDAVLRRSRSRFWHRRIQLPLPLAAAIALAAGLSLLWFGLRGAPADRPEVEGVLVVSPTDPDTDSALDRYDRGEPPALYTRKRSEG